jgi:hypothetical protein
MKKVNKKVTPKVTMKQVGQAIKAEAIKVDRGCVSKIKRYPRVALITAATMGLLGAVALS